MPEDENAKTLNKNDLNDDQLATLNILWQSGVTPSVIAKAMTESAQSTTGKKGQFVTDTINNGRNYKSLLTFLHILIRFSIS